MVKQHNCHFVSWLQRFASIHEKKSVFHTFPLMQHSNDFDIILIKIENYTLRIGNLRNKDQVTVKKS